MVGNVGLGDDPSIPQLMEFLRSAFKPRDFEDGKKILEKWKAETELLKGENDLLILDKVAMEYEMEGLKQLIVRVNIDRLATKERERNLLEGSAANGPGFGREEAAEIIRKIIEVENGKSAAEAEAAMWKKKYIDLGARISGVENDAIQLKSGENGDCSVPNPRVEEEEEEKDVPGCSENVRGGSGANGTVVPDFARVKIEVSDVSEFNQGTTSPVGALTSHPPPGRSSYGGYECIQISDSDSDFDLPTIPPEKQTDPEKSPQTSHSKGMDAERLSVTIKRKQSEIHNNFTDDTDISQPNKLVRLQETMTVERTSPSDEDSDSFSDSDDESVDEFISALKNNRKWKDEKEMALALLKDPELCMDAVCAIYRQEKSLVRLTHSKHRGFFPSDALRIYRAFHRVNLGKPGQSWSNFISYICSHLKVQVDRGTELAEFLIDGDKQGERRKCIKELVDHDDKGVEDCRRIATSAVNYTQLFDIYKNREDPFFPSSLL